MILTTYKPILNELDYLSQIRDVTGTLMSDSRRYVPFVGMYTAVQSVIMAVFDENVKPSRRAAEIFIDS